MSYHFHPEAETEHLETVAYYEAQQAIALFNLGTGLTLALTFSDADFIWMNATVPIISSSPLARGI